MCNIKSCPLVIHLPSVVQVCEGKECDADAAGLGALLLRLESLNAKLLVTHSAVNIALLDIRFTQTNLRQVILLPLVKREGVNSVPAAADDATGEGPHLEC